MRDQHHNGGCSKIDENAIELHAMGKLQKDSVRQHLDACDLCKERVAEHRAWIEDLKRGLQEFQQAGHTTGTGEDAGYASRQDGS